MGGTMGSIYIILIPLGLGLILSDIIGNPLGNFCANLLGGSNSNNYKHKPQPLYSIIKSKEAKGDYQGAFTEYRKAFEKFPRDKELFLGIIKLSMHNLNNKMMAEKYYKRGLEKISKKEVNSFSIIAEGYLSLGNDNWQNDETTRVKKIKVSNYDSNSSEKRDLYDAYDNDNIEDVWKENETYREKNEWEYKAANKVKKIQLKNHNNDETNELELLEKALAERRKKKSSQESNNHATN